MAYCRNCGMQTDDRAMFCPQCGASMSMPGQGGPMPGQGGSMTNDTGSVAWGILGFFIPLAGLILFFVWKDEKPRNAKMAGMGALISTVLGLLSGLVIAVVGVGMISSLASSYY